MSCSFQRRMSAALVATVVLIAGCSDGTVTTLAEGPTVSIALPEFLSSGAVSTDNVRPTIQLSNGANVSMQRGAGDNWSGTINVETGRTYTATVRWVENFEGQILPLAELTQELQVNKDGSIVRSDSSDYSTDFDFDGDGKTNFEERRDGKNPLDINDNVEPAQASDGDLPDSPTSAGTPDTALSPGNLPPDTEPAPQTEPASQPVPEPGPVQATADLVIPRIATSAAPQIDGAGVTVDAQGTQSGEWAAAIQVDNSGAPLLIDNLMIDSDAEAADGNPYRRWAAVHDGTYLYVVVVVDDNGDRHRDSGANLAQDDSLELFLDADNSKSQTYDKNDFHRLIPLQLAGADKQSATAGDVAGPNSSRADPGLRFATGPGIGPDGLRRARWEQDVYELRINLASAGIDLDSPFGFELQVNDDDGGGSRESKWAWKHPSRSDSDVDGTVSNPSLMGTLVLE